MDGQPGAYHNTIFGRIKNNKTCPMFSLLSNKETEHQIWASSFFHDENTSYYNNVCKEMNKNLSSNLEFSKKFFPFGCHSNNRDLNKWAIMAHNCSPEYLWSLWNFQKSVLHRVWSQISKVTICTNVCAGRGQYWPQGQNLNNGGPFLLTKYI